MPRTIIVTGAGSGIGATTAALLKERGDTVIGVDLRGADVEADLSTPDGRKAAADAAIAAAGGSVDAVVACAGIAAPIALTTAVNYFGVVEFLEHVRPTLAQSPAPRVAITSSFSSLQPVSAELVDAMLAGDEPRALEIGDRLEEEGPQVGFQNYSSSKRGVSRWIRKAGPTAQWGGAGIALNAVGPGVVETPMTRDLIAGDREALAAQIPMPLNGFAPPAAIAEVLAFLVSEGNSHMTGQTIYVDGGAESLLRGDDVIGQLPPVGGDAPPDLQGK